jgi:hypothetical protein
MALVTATITVDFIANYAGAHRVCWTIQGSGNPYDCTTLVNCVGGGTTCQAIFTTDVNTTSCDGTVTFEGYVQAACEDIASLNGRLPFTVDFVPNPVCTRHEFTCAYGEIDAINITNGGYLYLIGDPVVVTRQVGDTQVDDAIISINTLGDGVINSISGLLSGGLNYVALDVINIDNAGFGVGATITVDSVDGSGTILTYTLTTNGSGYIGPGAFTYLGGTGSGADFDIVEGVDFDSLGRVLSFTITNGGQYSIVPTITIPVSIDGGDLIAEAHIADCPDFLTVGEDCTNVTFDITGLQHAEVYAVCTNIDGVTGVQPPEYTRTDIGCCIPADTVDVPTCVDYHIENTTGGPENVEYTGCDGINFTAVVGAGLTVAVCAIVDGVLDPGIAGVNITTSMAECGTV